MSHQLYSTGAAARQRERGSASKEAHVVPDAGGTQANVGVGEADGDQRHPGPFHVVVVEPGDAAPELVAGALLGQVVRAAEAVVAAADEVPQRVAAEHEAGD